MDVLGACPVPAPAIAIAILAATAFALAATPGPAVAATSGDLGTEYEDLRPDDTTHEVKGLTLLSGKFRATLTTGRAALLLAGGQPVGLFFAGSGELEYRSNEPIEWPVVRYNLAHNTSLGPVEGAAELLVRDRFKRLLWLQGGEGQGLPALTGAPAPPLAADLARHRDRFDRLRSTTRAYQLALYATDPEARLVRAESSGGEEDLLYLHDPLSHGGEALYQVRKTRGRASELRKWRWLTLLSAQPIGRGLAARRPVGLRLTAVDLNLEASAGREARVIAEQTYVAADCPLRLLDLALLDTVYDAKNGELLPRHLVVESVEDGTGRPLAFRHEHDELLVDLGRTAEVGEPVRLRIVLGGDFLIRPEGDNYWMLGTESWFPQPEMSGQEYTLHVLVRVPRPFVPFASGVEVRRFSEGDDNLLETASARPVRFAVVLAGRYHIADQEQAGLRIQVASYAFKNPEAVRRLSRLGFEIVASYEAYLGPFPLPELNVIQINDFGWGQAPPGIVFITNEAFGRLDESTLDLRRGVNHRFAHEIAHQYWGNQVKWPGPEEQWISEAFAEYASALYLGESRGRRGFDDRRHEWEWRARQATRAAPLGLANRISDDAETRLEHRAGLLYNKGPYLLWRLNQELGDEVFRAFLGRVQRDFRWSNADTAGLAGILTELTGKDYRPFFDRHYWGTEMP